MTVRALITGGSGFIGRHLAAHLAAKGVEVTTVGRRPGAQWHYQLRDFTSVSELESLLLSVRPHQIYHLAGVHRAQNATEFYHVNAGFTAALLHAAERTLKAETIILLLGSAAEYGRAAPNQLPLRETSAANPDSHYGISKYTQTLMGLAATRRGMRVVLPRAFNIIGPGMPNHLALADFANQIVEIELGYRPPTLSTGDLGAIRDFIDVRDAAQILHQMVTSEHCFGRVVNLCSGRPVRMIDLVRSLIAASSRDISIQADRVQYFGGGVPVSYGSAALLETLVGRHLMLDTERICADILEDARVRSVKGSPF